MAVGKRNEELFEQNRIRLIINTGLPIGHYHGTLNKMVLYKGDLSYRQCNKETETARNVFENIVMGDMKAGR